MFRVTLKQNNVIIDTKDYETKAEAVASFQNSYFNFWQPDKLLDIWVASNDIKVRIDEV